MGSTAKAVYVVTGASRGLGLEFVKQILERGGQVVAAARNPKSGPGLESLAAKYPSTLSVVTLDVSDPKSIKAAAKAISSAHPDGIDVLINNAGTVGAVAPASEQDEEDFKDILFTNVLGPFLVVKSLLPLIKKGNKKQIVQLSSSMGSVGLTVDALKEEVPNPLARFALGYRVSKAALNMETASLAVDLKKDGVAVYSVHPGWVATDMGNAAATLVGAKEGPSLDAPTSVAGMLKVVDGLTLEQSGSFHDYEGNVMPY